MFKNNAEPCWPYSTSAQSGLAAKSQRHVLEKLKRAETLMGDDLGRVRHLIDDLGAVNVAKMLVDPTEIRNPPRCFFVLMKCTMDQFSIEQAIVDFAKSRLFDEAEIEAAQARLAIFSRNQRYGDQLVIDARSRPPDDDDDLHNKGSAEGKMEASPKIPPGQALAEAGDLK